jgi:hypothetical protein
MDYQSDASSRSFRVSSEHLVFGDFVIQRSTTRTGTTYEDLLYFNASRAATFSSSIAANGIMSLGNDGTYGSTYKTLGLTGNSNGSHRIFAGTADNLYIAAATARGINFWTDGSSAPRMIITSGGNIGIGTDVPLKNVHIARGGNVNGILFTDDSAGNYRNEINNTFNGGTAASNLMTFLVSNATTTGQTTVMTLNGAGNVGIGTSSASSLSGGINLITRGVASANNGYIQALSFDAGSSVALYSGVSSSDNPAIVFQKNLRFGSCGDVGVSSFVEKMRITNNTDRTQVLVGTDTPIYTNVNRGQLVVNGASNSLIGLQRNGGGAIGYLYGDAGSFQIAADSGLDIFMYPLNAVKAGVDNAYTMGASGARWSAIWAANGTIQTSDARQKKDITDTNLGLDFINKLRPVSYKWIVGGNSVEVSESDNENEVVKRTITANEGKRNHYGLIAQEVKEVLGDIDFGGYVYDEETDTMALRYDQFISPMIKAIQELTQKVNALENK